MFFFVFLFLNYNRAKTAYRFDFSNESLFHSYLANFNVNCTVITSFLPVSAPANTIVAINGSGFKEGSGVSSVKFGGVEASSFVVVSDVLIQAVVPKGAVQGNISVVSNNCEGKSGVAFVPFVSECIALQDVYISEVFDRNGESYGMIELYNPTNKTIVFNSQYVLERYGTIGDASPSGGNYVLTLIGSIAAYDTYLIASTNPPIACGTKQPIMSMGGINEDDEFKLKKNGQVIDNVHVPGQKGYSFIRRPNAIAPKPTYTRADWNIKLLSKDEYACSDLGKHAATPQSITTPVVAHPVSKNVCENLSTTFSVSVAGTGSYTYQWKMLNSAGIWVNVINNINYSGATTRTLSVNQIPVSFDSNQYYCEIKSTDCTLYSDAVQLKVFGVEDVLVQVIQPTCKISTGSITVTAPLGSDLEYSIDGINFQKETLFDNLSDGDYNVIVKTEDDCKSSTSVNIKPIPVAPAEAVTTLVQPNCKVATGSVIITSPVGEGYTYSIDGITFQSSTIFGGLKEDSYTITVKFGDCITTSTQQVVINSSPEVPAKPQILITQLTCFIDTATILVTAPLGLDLEYSIDGINFQKETTFNAVKPGEYTVVVKNANCESEGTVVDIKNVTLPDTPALIIIQPTCETPMGTITINSPRGNGFTYSIDGVNFQDSPVFNALSPDDYTVIVRNVHGCESTDIVTINNPPIAPDPGVISGNTELCEGEMLQLSNTITNGTWSSSNPAIATVNSTGVVTALTSGTVKIRYSVGNNNCTAFTEVIINVNALPRIALNDMYLCTDENGNIENGILYSGFPAASYTFKWSKDGVLLNSTDNKIIVSTSGVYSLVVINNTTGCSSTAIATVGISSKAIATATVGTDFNSNQTIAINVTGGSGDYEYRLNDGIFQDNPYFTNIYEGEYTVTVRDKNGCGDTVLFVHAINYPRFFTPNGDGYNDIWNISGLKNHTDAKIHIFDRYGKLITALKPGISGWDGTYNGKKLPATDYWFQLFYQSNGIDKEFKAHFSLKR